MKIIILYYWQIGRNEKNSNRFNLVPMSILSEYLLEYCCCIWMYVSIKWVDPCGDGITKIWLNWFGDFTKVSVWYTSRFFFKNEDVFPSVNYHLLSVRIMTSFLQIYYMASKEMLSTRPMLWFVGLKSRGDDLVENAPDIGIYHFFENSGQAVRKFQ